MRVWGDEGSGGLLDMQATNGLDVGLAAHRRSGKLMTGACSALSQPPPCSRPHGHHHPALCPRLTSQTPRALQEEGANAPTPKPAVVVYRPTGSAARRSTGSSGGSALRAARGTADCVAEHVQQEQPPGGGAGGAVESSLNERLLG